MTDFLTSPFEIQEMAIMIVDDVPTNIQFLGKILKAEGFKISPASNGKKALEMIPRVKPDLVLMDIMMPGMDGFEVCKRMKNSPDMKDIPVIFLSALNQPEDVVKGFKLGAADYISKPFNTEELLVRVRNHIELVNSRKLIVHYMDEVGKQNQQLQQMAISDSLTGLYNHSFSIERLHQEAYNARRYGNPLTVMMLDIDYFKNVNDAHGHPFGDEVLKTVTEIIRSNIREGDIAGRYGGEEFLLVLPNTPLDGGLIIAERIRERVENNTWDFSGLKLTISAGVRQMTDQDPADLIKQADSNLYMAKEQGRNRVVASGGGSPAD